MAREDAYMPEVIGGILAFAVLSCIIGGCVNFIKTGTKNRENIQAQIEANRLKREKDFEEFGVTGTVVGLSSSVGGSGRTMHAIPTVILENESGKRIEVLTRDKLPVIGDKWSVVWSDRYYPSLKNRIKQ